MESTEMGDRKELGRWRSVVAALPGVGIALLPKVACPACWPAYAGLLSSLGLGFLVVNSAYLLPVTVLFLGIAVLALTVRASSRRGYGPAILGTVAAAMVVIGKFGVESSSVTFAGVAGLIGASVWNAWPRRESASTRCGRCSSSGELIEIGTVSGLTEEKETMTTKRTVEVFSAGCSACQDAVALVKRIACPSCEVTVLDMNDQGVAKRAKDIGIRSVPAVVVNGKLAECCKGNAPDEAALRALGLGQSVA